LKAEEGIRSWSVTGVQTCALPIFTFSSSPFTPQVLKHPYAFNLFSHDTDVDPESGYNGEELKVIAECRRILSRPELPVGVTCVRSEGRRGGKRAVCGRCRGLEKER